MITNDQLVEYYKNLLILQYRTQPRAAATIEALSRQGVIFELLTEILEGYDVLTATGVPLDILAKYNGINRAVIGLDFSRDYFGYALYGETTPFTLKGYAMYGDIVTVGQMRDYRGSLQSEYSLTDNELRNMIFFAIIRNNFKATVKETDELLQNIFGDTVFMDDGYDMNIAFYTDPINARFVEIADGMGLLPIPAAVGYEVTVSEVIERITEDGEMRITEDNEKRIVIMND